MFAGTLGSVVAQDMGYPFKDKNPAKMKSRAKNALRSGDIYTALFYYQELVRISPNNLIDQYQLAELYRASRNSLEAEKVYT